MELTLRATQQATANFRLKRIQEDEDLKVIYDECLASISESVNRGDRGCIVKFDFYPTVVSVNYITSYLDLLGFTVELHYKQDAIFVPVMSTKKKDDPVYSTTVLGKTIQSTNLNDLAKQVTDKSYVCTDVSLDIKW